MTIIAPRVGLAPRDVLPRQVVRFVAVGVVNTGLFLVVYLGFRVLTPAVVANVLATVLTTVVGTSANGKVTFGVEGTVSLRQHVRGLAVTVLGLAITSGAVLMSEGALAEIVVLTVATAVTGGLRFVLLRWWVFTPGR